MRRRTRLRLHWPMAYRIALMPDFMWCVLALFRRELLCLFIADVQA